MKKKITVLCTLPLDPAGVAMLAPIANIVVSPDQRPATLYRMIGDADMLVVRNQLPADLFERPNRLMGVIRHGTGLDLIPVESATARCIPVANVPGANAQAVAEYCVASFMALARRLPALNQTLRADTWSAARALAGGASELADKTVGIVGVGMIGGAVAKICKHGFGMRVLGNQRNLNHLPAFVEPADLDELFASSDFVALTCPLTPTTRHLVNAERLRRMRRTAFLVNAARGPVIDEPALITALKDGWIAGAALDVYNEQPLAADHPLRALDNVLLTPHVAGLTDESTRAMSIGTAAQILALIAGERPQYLVNPEIWDGYRQRWASFSQDNRS